MAHDAKESGRSGNAASAFQKELEAAGVVTFRSWNGKAVRTDGDTEFAFYRDGRVGMLEYGFTLTKYWGAYELQKDGGVSVRFEKFPHPWPIMVLDQDDRDLLLWPENLNTGIVMGTRGGSYAPRNGTYWPFRELDAGQNKEVLNELGR